MKNTSSKNTFMRFGAWLKERVRKLLVALKKNPQAIPLGALLVSFMQYSLNLTHISNTTSKLVSIRLEGSNAGLAAFITMLLLILSFVCMLGAFPKRHKPKLSMVILMVVMYAIVICADLHYLQCIDYALNHETNPIVLTPDLMYIATARETLSLNIILVAITIVCVILEPLFAKLIKKINTSIDVESGAEITSIDISSED